MGCQWQLALSDTLYWQVCFRDGFLNPVNTWHSFCTV